jgi:small subunit ribosomal protein S6
MKVYETLYILKPEASDDEVKSTRDKFEKTIKSFNGRMIAWDDWGKRRLAYPIQKHSHGKYVYLVYTAEGQVIAELERQMKIMENIIRYMSVRMDKNFDEQKFLKHYAGKSILEKKPEAAAETATP